MPDRHPRGVAYEFHGCLYHGCPVCYKDRDAVLIPNSEQTASELLALTRHKEERLRAEGLQVVSIWEHEFNALLTADKDAKAFVDGLEVMERLDPRDSLMGGRTNGCVLYKRASGDTKIKYVDFTSLYPFVNKTCRYPVGHPEIITRNFRELDSYFGLAKVKVLPPRRLFHPVLGYREGGKLTFPLCRTCVERRQQEPCNLTKTQFVHDSQAHVLFGHMADPTVEIVDFNIVDDENLMLSTKRASEMMCPPGHTNVFLASFTTCWARLKLYELLDRLQRRVLYWDMDSVIYTTKQGQWEPPTGDYLGELTDELTQGDWITEFVCNGPKNYAYQTHQGKRVCKVKGFSLNYANSQILNLESMRDAMFNRDDPTAGTYHTVNTSKICREKVHSELYCQEELKQYSAVYTKRVVQSDLSTLPYGY